MRYGWVPAGTPGLMPCSVPETRCSVSWLCPSRLNRYTYAAANPIMYWDPDGRAARGPLDGEAIWEAVKRAGRLPGTIERRQRPTATDQALTTDEIQADINDYYNEYNEPNVRPQTANQAAAETTGKRPECAGGIDSMAFWRNIRGCFTDWLGGEADKNTPEVVKEAVGGVKNVATGLLDSAEHMEYVLSEAAAGNVKPLNNTISQLPAGAIDATSYGADLLMRAASGDGEAIGELGSGMFVVYGGRLVFRGFDPRGRPGTTAASSSRWSRTEFGGNRVYQRSDLIDPGLVDDVGRTNLQRMESGLAPIGPDGRSLQLHHMTQRQTGSIAEVTATMHQQNSQILHINPSSIPSGIDRSAFNVWRADYWKWRAKDFE